MLLSQAPQNRQHLPQFFPKSHILPQRPNLVLQTLRKPAFRAKRNPTRPESIPWISHFPPAKKKKSRTQSCSCEGRRGDPGLICRADLGLGAEKYLAIPPFPIPLPTEQSCSLLTRPGAEGLGEGGTGAQEPFGAGTLRLRSPTAGARPS